MPISKGRDGLLMYLASSLDLAGIQSNNHANEINWPEQGRWHSRVAMVGCMAGLASRLPVVSEMAEEWTIASRAPSVTLYRFCVLRWHLRAPKPHIIITLWCSMGLAFDSRLRWASSGPPPCTIHTC